MYLAARDVCGAAGAGLLEALVAMALVATVASGAGWLLLWSSRTIRDAGTATLSVTFAQQKLEQLTALTWRFADGVRVSDVSTDLTWEPLRAGGNGLAASPGDSLDRNAAGYFDFVDAGGTWCGSGSTPPAQARFVRRWAIQPVPADPDDTLLLSVLVAPVSDGETHTSRRVVLQTIRTRAAE